MENEKSEKVFTQDEILKKEAFLRELGYPEAADMLRQQVGILNRLAEYREHCVYGEEDRNGKFSCFVADNLDYIFNGDMKYSLSLGDGIKIKEDVK